MRGWWTAAIVCALAACDGDGKGGGETDDSGAGCDADSYACDDGCCACPEEGAFTAFALPFEATGADAGDLDGDGRIDLVIGNGTTLGALTANECGALAGVQTVLLSASSTSFAAGDRGDGTVGVLALDENAAVTLRTGATLDFAYGETLADLAFPGHLVPAHLDTDGDDDCAILESDFGTLYRVEDTGSGFAVRASVTLPPGIDRVQAGPLGGNERDEILFLGAGLAEVASSGDFIFDQVTLLASSLHTSAAFGDFDGDGDGDAAIGAAGAVELWVTEGADTDPIELEGTTAIEGTPLDVASVDLDGDGQPEVVALSPDGVLDILAGLEDGTFVRRTTLAVAEDAFEVATGDVDGDGRGDLVVIAPAQAEIGIGFASP